MQDDDGRWGTLAEVADAYGVSVDTIRRRMKRGGLEARKEQTPQGFKWLAIMPEPTTEETAQNAPGSPRTGDSAAQGGSVPDRDVLLETLQHELAIRNREITRLHEVVAYQAHAIERATAALPATTRRDAPGRAESPPHDSRLHDASATPVKRWRFWEWVRGR